jgi:hypothetical protein
MRKEMFDFIRLKTPNIKEVLDVRLKDSDDEDGYIGEHYIVSCLLNVLDTTIPINNMFGEVEKKCLVDVDTFKRWLNDKSSIKWI